MNQLEISQKDRWDTYAGAKEALANYEDWLKLPGRKKIHQFYMDTIFGNKILEVGCGAGHLMSALLQKKPELDLTGLDLSDGMLELAAERGLKKLVQGSGNELPFPDATFDTVIAPLWVFRYLDPQRGMNEARRVLRPGGQLLFDVPIFAGMLMEGLSEAIRKPRQWKKGFINQRMQLNVIYADTWKRRAIRAGFSEVRSTGILEIPGLTQRFNWAPTIENSIIKNFCLTVLYQAHA